MPKKLPPPDQMPEKKLAALREMLAIARHGAAKKIKLSDVKNEREQNNSG